MNSSAALAEQLCLNCGLCCNGALFKDVELQPGDDPARLKALGLAIGVTHASSQIRKFAQPCAALDGCRCRLYAERPQHCRAFECALFQAVHAGKIETAAALRTIRAARRRLARVLRLLRAVGDTDEHRPVSARFRRTAKRLEANAPDAELAALFGRLTLAVHDLNLLLSESFYPGKDAQA